MPRLGTDVFATWAEALPLGFGARHPEYHPLGNPRAFELGDGGKDMQLQFPGWCRRINALGEGDEGDPQGHELVHQQHEVTEVPPESIQSPDDDGIDLPTLGILDETIQRRARIFRARDAVIDVRLSGPALGLDVATQLEELIFRLLIECRDSGVDGGSHADLPWADASLWD